VDICDERLPDGELGPLIARGRDADVFALGADRVVRRTSGGGDLAAEGRLMEHVRAAGYPVPRVWRVSPDEMVMDRVEGPTMVDVLVRRPWTAGRLGRTLGQLHRALHAIAAPGWLRGHPAADGDRVLHLDLHPLNVMVSPGGPVVIDWSNARRGPAPADAADVWIVLACMGREPSTATSTLDRARDAVIGRIEPAVRGRLLGAFLDEVGRAATRTALPAAAELRLLDRNVRPHERAAIERLVAKEAG